MLEAAEEEVSELGCATGEKATLASCHTPTGYNQNFTLFSQQ
jgi:hypothetical protein